MDCFQRLEALVDSAAVDDIEEATALLRRFKGRSREVAAAIDEFMLDFMTLVFVVENGEEGFERPVRKLARTRLSKLERLVTVTAEEKPASSAGYPFRMAASLGMPSLTARRSASVKDSRSVLCPVPSA